MTTDRLDAVLERLDGVREATEDDEVRRELREAQQLLVGVKSDLEDGLRADRAGPRESEPADED